MSQTVRNLQFAADKKWVLPETFKNALRVLNEKTTADWVKASIAELVIDQSWTELNDRFYKTLSFGTGGIRGRTIGKIVTKAETGTPTPLGRPQYPAVGTNTMNFFNISRATQGLVNYVKKNFTPVEPNQKAKIVIGHDTRHYSREFAEFTAQLVADMGADAYLFESERSTPETSFAIRHLEAQAGVVITASHNPSHDNGFKVYYEDGAQVVEPHASGIITEVNAITSELILEPALDKGTIHGVGREIDEAYTKKVIGLVLDPTLVAQQSQSLKIVFSPLHGTGAKLVPRILKDLGFNFSLVAEQTEPDGRFPTVLSPNPENAEAMALGMNQAIREGADIVVATDPDADRMGAAAKIETGEMVLLNGNQIGSLMAWYRTKKHFELGYITKENASHAALIKTFVTTDLQKAIAKHFGVKLVETLTGFKYIGEKLRIYTAVVIDHKKMSERDWRELSEGAKRDLLLKFSTYYIFGGEESYGYSANEYARDKDANAAVAMLCEVAAYAKSVGKTLITLLDDIYADLGYFSEKLGQLTLEGAEGSMKIQKVLASFDIQPPTGFGSEKILKVEDYAKQDLVDVDGKTMPKEKMFIFHLESGSRIAVRGSGTEPKVKFYMFGQTLPTLGTKFTITELAEAKAATTLYLDSLWETVKADAQLRMD